VRGKVSCFSFRPHVGFAQEAFVIRFKAASIENIFTSSMERDWCGREEVLSFCLEKVVGRLRKLKIQEVGKASLGIESSLKR
jgi:hypothetical protein